MRERRLAAHLQRTGPDPYAGLATVHASSAYDLIGSLRALYNPRTYTATRSWAASARARLEPEWYERGRFFFQGFDTALGYGALRAIPDLGARATPERLIRAIRASAPPELALRMLDTGELSEAALAAFRRALAGRPGRRELDAVLRGMPAEWARRCRRIVSEPEAVRDELASFLEAYHARVFAGEVEHVEDQLRRAAGSARDLLGVLPTVEAIERLSGGYTLADDLTLRRIVLAPSVFLYPFMSSRLDAAAGEALIVYGVPTNVFVKYDRVPVDPQLVGVLKALSEPGRLRVLRLLADEAKYGTELITALGLSQPTVHHHLAQLRAVGLVRQERTKGGMRYALRRDRLAAAIGALERMTSSRRASERGRELHGS